MRQTHFVQINPLINGLQHTSSRKDPVNLSL